MDNFDNILQGISSHKQVAGVLKEHPDLAKSAAFFSALLHAKKVDDDTITLFDMNVQQDKDLALELVSTWPYHSSYRHLVHDVRLDKRIAQAAFTGNSGVIDAFTEDLLKDEPFMFALVDASYPVEPILKHMPASYASNKDFVMLLLKKQYQSFAYVSEALKADEEVLWRALFGSGTWYGPTHCFPLAPNSLKGNKEFVKRVLEEVKSFRDKKSIIDLIKQEHKVAAATLKGAAAGALAKAKADIKSFKKRLESADSYENKSIKKEFESFCASDLSALQSDEKIVLAALEAEFSDRFMYDKKTCYVFAGTGVCVDKAFAAKCMSATNGQVFPYLPQVLKDDSTFVMENFSDQIKPEWMSSHLKSDPLFMGSLIESHPNAYNIKQMIAPSLYQSVPFMQKVLPINGALLESAADALKKDPSMVRLALQSFQNALSYAHPTLLEDESLLVESMKLGGHAFLTKLTVKQRANKDLFVRLAQAAAESATALRSLLRGASVDLKKDKELVLLCVRVSGWALESADEELKYDKDVLIAAFKTGCHVYKDLDHKKLRTLYSEKDLKRIAGNLYEYID